MEDSYYIDVSPGLIDISCRTYELLDKLKVYIEQLRPEPLIGEICESGLVLQIRVKERWKEASLARRLVNVIEEQNISLKINSYYEIIVIAGERVPLYLLNCFIFKKIYKDKRFSNSAWVSKVELNLDSPGLFPSGPDEKMLGTKDKPVSYPLYLVYEKECSYLLDSSLNELARSSIKQPTEEHQVLFLLNQYKEQ